jgi:glutathione-regulated potassium-efflux system protein KefB
VLPWALDLGARQRNYEALAVLAVLAVAAAAWMMEVAGLSMALGGFVMGLLLSGSGYVRQIEAEITPYKGVLLGLFFVSIGMSMDLGLLAQAAGRIGIAVLLVLVVKALLLLLLALAFRLKPPTAVRLAFLLPQGGEFGFVLFGTAHAGQLLSDTAFHAALLVISLSMAVTPMLARIGDRLATRLSPTPLPPESLPDTTLDRHVVIAGFGRVGRNIGFMLEQSGVPFVALDADPRRVALGRREGRPVYFGHSSDLRVLSQAGAGRAAAVVVTLDNTAATEDTVASLREAFPQIPVVVRARDLASCDRLLAIGASEAIPESVQLSTSVGEALLRRVGASQAQIEAVFATMRQDNYANLRLGAIRERMAEVGRGES